MAVTSQALLSLLAVGAVCAPPVKAQSVIGQAVQAAPQVTGALGARRATIVSGAAVHQNETIQTSAEGSTVLKFHDATSLTVGPSASVRLDRFIYNADATARQAVVNMTKGAFRWSTGASDPDAFKLQTPHAVIGIRGTVLDIDVNSGRTRVTLRQGAIVVCARAGRGRSCVDVNAPGRSVTVLADGSFAEPDEPIIPPQRRAGVEFSIPFMIGPFGGGGGGRPGYRPEMPRPNRMR